MRGVTSSSVVDSACRQPLVSKAAARRQETVVPSVHMVGLIRSPGQKQTILSKNPWNSLRSSRSHIIFLQAEGELTCP